jgi:hypothetical protein
MTIIGSWQHARLASGGTSINVDYVPQEKRRGGSLGEAVIYAQSPWLNVKDSCFTPDTQVTAKLIDVSKRRLGFPPQSETGIELPLEYAGNGRFTAGVPIELGILSSGPHADTVRHAWKLSVLVNGNPLIDPMNGSDTFNIDPPAS